MFKTERVPVTLFQSTDEGAPQLTAAEGSLKTILKACLVTGYGEKQPLGWEASFEDNTYIAFRSKHNKASRCWISVDNKYERAAEVSGFHDMTAKKTGDKEFGAGLVQLLQTKANNAPWILVGHQRGFCLLIRSAYYYPERCSQMIYFGDFSSLAPADDRNCILLKSGHDLGNSKYISSNHSGIGGNIFATTLNSVIDTRQAALASSTGKLEHNITMSFSSAAQGHRGVSYPDFISQGFSAFEIFMNERVANGGGYEYCLRGLLGGMMAIRESLEKIEDFVFFDNLDDSGDRFVKFGTNDQVPGRDCFLLNCTAWEI